MLLWLHVLVIPCVALLRGQTLMHSVLEGSLVAWPAVGAVADVFSRAVRSGMATLGLVISSAVLVHLFDGLIELHFHFFVVVAVAALYQSWLPFLLALAFVVVHHSLVGTFFPSAVYNHPAATTQAWWFGVVHGAFILAESVACLVYWRASEDALESERAARIEAQEAHRDLARAQELAGMGSWEWDLRANTIRWSDQMFVLAGADGSTFVPTVDCFLDLVHPEDRIRVSQLIWSAYRGGTDLDYECRLVRQDGTVRTIHALGQSVMLSGELPALMRGTCQDVTERKQLQDAIVRLAHHDPLTDLANRRLFTDRLERALEAGTRVALLFIDLDGFKLVNDNHGHTVGDALLQEIAHRLMATTREADTVARLGGDEFAVLMEGVDLDTAQRCADRVDAALALPTVIGGRDVFVTASVGVAVADEGGSSDKLLRRADKAMYSMKESRRQRARATV